MINIAAFTGGENVPSARFRIRQYIDKLYKQGIRVDEFGAALGSYPPAFKPVRPFWGMATIAQRIPQIFASYHYQVSLLQREMVSSFATLEHITKAPRILDVDDAIWLNRKNFAEKIARRCDAIICGNSFLAEYFTNHNNSIHILPTAVDSDYFLPSPSLSERNMERTTIVWSGSSSGHKYLTAIEPALHSVAKDFKKVNFRIVSNSPPRFRLLPIDRVEYVSWSALNEVTVLQNADIGIMPLTDSLWERGKCSFKMLTYMACGLPVVVSPVGMNAEILTRANIGFGAKEEKEWIESLVFLIRNRSEAENMGARGRRLVESEFSAEKIALRLAMILKAYA